jgi:hypothetical protein
LRRPSLLGRFSKILLSPGEGHKRKKPTPACRLGLGIVAYSPTGYLRLINGFTALSSTSTSDFVFERGYRRAVFPDFPRPSDFLAGVLRLTAPLPPVARVSLDFFPIFPLRDRPLRAALLPAFLVPVLSVPVLPRLAFAVFARAATCLGFRGFRR